MLTDLHIENIAVIERADLAFGPGFNVLTGETGAGKSIVIDAIDAVLGGRVSREIVRRGAEKALVSAVFTDVDAADWFRENDIEPPEELIVQRRIGADGKSACRVSGVPVTVQQLHALGARLLEIHGQNDGRALLDEARHLEYLDRYAAPEREKADYAAAYGAWKKLRREIERLSMDELEKERRTALLEKQIGELEQAQLKDGEEAELLARAALLQNSEKLTEALEDAYAALYGGEANAIDLCAEAERRVGEAARYAPELREAAEGISDARFRLADALERVNDLREGLDFSGEEFDRIEARLSLLRRLERRYGADEAGLIALLADSRTQLAELSSSGELLEQLEKDAEKARKAVLRAGEGLRAARRAGADALAKRVAEELRYLNMPSVRFLTELTPVSGRDGFDATGLDCVRFLMSANAGEEPGRISRIASGGELSRIMLAMKRVFAEKDAVQSLVFDEIDTGVSGVAAQRVGEKMGELSRVRQLLCITHLPQIAAMADRHFNISKTERGGRTYTVVTELDRDGRIRELARLHGGEAVTETTLKSAAEQLDAAADFKKRAIRGGTEQ